MKTTTEMHKATRGETVTNGAGATGLFVGLDAKGCRWVAWEPEAYPAMCAAFDASMQKAMKWRR